MVAINGDTADIPSVNFGVQGSDITAPGASRAQLYVKSSGVWYILNGGTATRLADNPLTTAGDIIVSGASGLPSRLAKGSDSDVLTIDPATHLPVWAAPTATATNDAARVSRASAQTISNNTVTPVTFTSEDFDNNGLVDLGANDDRITIVTAGLYLLTGRFEWGLPTTNLRYSYIRVNGTDYVLQRVSGASATENRYYYAVVHAVLAVNDYVQLVAKQDSGGSLDLTAGVLGVSLQAVTP